MVHPQDCDHEGTKNVIQSYKEAFWMRHPNQGPITIPTNMPGYFKIARHYKWALDTAFAAGFESLIIVEGKCEAKRKSRKFINHSN